MPQILTTSYCSPTARLLRDKIQELTGKHLWVTTNPQKRNIVISWGSSDCPASCLYNSSGVIASMADKRAFSQIMLEAGINSPIYTRGTLPNSDQYPVLIRTTLSGTAGVGIIVCRNESEFLTNNGLRFWWTPFFKTISEYRVHLIGGEIKRILKKLPVEGYTEPEFPIRNLHSENYRFSLRTDYEAFDNLFPLVQRFHQAFPTKFCGLDVGWSRQRQEYIIFEANSAPGLDNPSALLYAEYLVHELSL